MRYYLDTSVIVSAITKEAATAATQTWLRDQSSNTYLISEWSVAEVVSALSIKVQTDQISVRSQPLAVVAFNSVFRQGMEVVRV